jgi:hypothetical protein
MTKFDFQKATKATMLLFGVTAIAITQTAVMPGAGLRPRWR